MTLEIQTLAHPIAKSAGITLNIARADLLHPLASGNKFYKLAPNLEYAKQQGFKRLLSFGGAFSNHIHALALTAQAHGFSSIGIIRGEAEYARNPTLQDAQSAGMQLQFVSRDDYRRRNNADYLKVLQDQFPEALIIPEGGSNQLAIQGCKQLANEINAKHEADIITVACGTGATLAGIVCGLNNEQTAIGYAVLKDKSLQKRVDDFIKKEDCHHDLYHIELADFGGYAKMDKALLNFIFEWLEQTGILLDPIYTGKMCMRLMQKIASGEFKEGTSITLLHSGGLQGWRGMKSQFVKLLGEEKWGKLENYL